MQIKSRYITASARTKKGSGFKHFFYLFVWVAISVLFLVSIVLLLRASFLQLNKVEVSGNVVIQKEEIESLVLEQISGFYLFVFPKSNYFFVKKEKLVQNILVSLSRVEEVEINKNFNGTLGINLKERQEDFVWCALSACYSMNQRGLSFAEVNKEEVAGKIIFRNSLEEVGLLKNFGGEEAMLNYLKALEIFKSAKFEVSEIDLDLADKVIFETSVGAIFLNPEEDLAETALNAVILINEVQTKTPSAQFDYIDARFGNKVFYKLK